jgi:hypothetical protein
MKGVEYFSWFKPFKPFKQFNSLLDPPPRRGGGKRRGLERSEAIEQSKAVKRLERGGSPKRKRLHCLLLTFLQRR